MSASLTLSRLPKVPDASTASQGSGAAARPLSACLASRAEPSGEACLSPWLDCPEDELALARFRVVPELLECHNLERELVEDESESELDDEDWEPDESELPDKLLC